MKICLLTSEYFMHTCRKLCFDRRLCLNGIPINHVVLTGVEYLFFSISNISFKNKL